MRTLLRLSLLIILGASSPIDILAQNVGFIFAEKEPRPVNIDSVQKIIAYPVKAYKNGIEGTVVMRVLVDENGNYVKHSLLSGPKIFVKAVNKHVKKLRFTPAISDGQPIPFWVNIPFGFKLLR